MRERRRLLCGAARGLWTHTQVLPVPELELNELVAQIGVKLQPARVGGVVVAKRVQGVRRMVDERFAGRLVDGLQQGGAPFRDLLEKQLSQEACP
jgi:hypothetical protein